MGATDRPARVGTYLWPAVVVTVAMIVLEVGYGADLGPALLFLGYLMAYRILPGVLLYRFLSSDPGGPLKQLAIGWVTGMALEIGAFMVTAALDVRWVFALYPLIVGLPLIALLVRDRRGSAESPRQEAAAELDPRAIWGLAVLCVLAIGMIAIAFFPTMPLPGTGAISYFQDIPWHLSLAAEAKHHWPIEDPTVAGQPLPYHYFFHIQLAAVGQVTGIELATVYFRLAYLPLFVLTVLLVVTAGKTLTRNIWIGLLAGFLALFIGDLQLETDPLVTPQAPFLGVFITFLFVSPSFLLGMTFLLALVVVGYRILTPSERLGPGDWVLLALLCFGASNSKIVVLPFLLAALAMLVIWSRWRDGRIQPRAIAFGAIAAVVIGLTYLSQYRGHSSGLTVNSLESFNQMPVVGVVKSYLLSALPDFPLKSVILGAAGVVVGLLGLLAPLIAGFAWLRTSRSSEEAGDSGNRKGPGLDLVWPITFFIAGILALLFIAAPGTGDQLYFVQYGIAVGWIVAAAGYAVAWRTRPGEASSRAAIVAAGGFAAVVIVVAAPGALDLFTGPDAVAQTFLFWYAGLAVALVAVGVIAWRTLRPRGWWTGALLSAAVLGIGLLGTLSNYVFPSLSSDPAQAADASTSPRALTPDLYEAMEWTRDNTPVDAVLAVNDDSPYAFDWSAFAERRVFLSGAAYTRLSLDRGYDETLNAGVESLFPAQFGLNADAFSGDPAALATLYSKYGVRYLVLDPRGDVPADLEALAELTEPAHTGAGIAVLRLLPEQLPLGP